MFEPLAPWTPLSNPSPAPLHLNTKFVAIILEEFFRLTDFSSDLFDFSSLKRDKHVSLGGH